MALFIGTNAGLDSDLLALEYDLFGDFVCDLVVGDSRTNSYLLVEFEDAKPDSLFVKKHNKSTPDWSPRFERGFSQVVDWFWRLSDAEKSDDYHHRFGTRRATMHGMVVVGRDQQLADRELRRLNWRQDLTIVHSRKISIMTYDQLVRDLKYSLGRYSGASR